MLCHYCGFDRARDDMVTKRKCSVCAAHKVCRQCGERKPIDAFGQLAGRVCKVCKPAYDKDRAQRLYGQTRGSILAKNKAWKQANAPRYHSQQRDYRNAKRAEIKASVLAHYGGVCACCSEDEPKFLTIDHMNDDGSKHRRQIGVLDMWKWLYHNKFPAGYQLLCYNCNAGRYRNGGTCPHVERRAAAERAS